MLLIRLNFFKFQKPLVQTPKSIEMSNKVKVRCKRKLFDKIIFIMNGYFTIYLLLLRRNHNNLGISNFVIDRYLSTMVSVT